MKITKTLYAPNRKVWRDWLKKHYKTDKEIWLVYYRKPSGKTRISYNDAVEEALCFGWIDSTVKTLDGERTVQKFSPRKPKSGYSQPNKERLQWLMARGKVMKDVLTTLGDISAEQYQFPPDILNDALQANEQAWRNFQQYSGSYQRIRVALIDVARKRPAEFQKRLRHLIRMTEQNKQFGYGIEKYF
ncbi:MAG: YdeI/OmpD-associated family protein [Candidatus Aminicenantes bacterium]|nr:YdeI/OmpD-associated family protein [Candidatus Aminicenantes bacterium]